VRARAPQKEIYEALSLRWEKLEHDPEKWKPVFNATNAKTRLRADHAQANKLDHDAISLHRIMI
jgi:hypothetical protein